MTASSPQTLDGGAIDGRRGEQVERLLAQRLVVVGIRRNLGEFRRDDVVNLGLLRRAGADGIERARDGVLDERQAGAMPPAHGVHPRRHRRGAADAERDAAGEDADERHGARPGRRPLLAPFSCGGWIGGSGCSGTLSILVMTISFVDGAKRHVEKEANRRTFRAIRPNVKNSEGIRAIWRRGRSRPRPDAVP